MECNFVVFVWVDIDKENMLMAVYINVYVAIDLGFNYQVNYCVVHVFK